MKPAAAAPQPKLILDQDLISDVTKAVQITLDTFFGVKAAPDGALLHSGFAFIADVSARIEMVQQTSRDAFLVTAFQEPAILGIMSKFYGRAIPVLDKSVMDCVGEITNSTYGQVKHRLNQRGYSFKLTIPEMTRGGQRFVSEQSGNLLVTFTTEFGVICAGIVLCKS